MIRQKKIFFFIFEVQELGINLLRGTRPMKSRSPLFALVLALCLLGSPGLGRSWAAEIWTSGGLAGVSESSFPMLHGMILVWQARGGLDGSVSAAGDWEIFLCDLSTLHVVQVTDDDSDDTLPQTDGEYVVWQKYDPAGGNRIFLHRIVGSAGTDEELISPADGSDNYGPKIASGHVVWTSQRVTESYLPARVMLYEARTHQAARVISNPAREANDPRIDGSRLFWRQQEADGSLALWYCDLDSEAPVARPAPDRFACNRSPAVEGHVNVLARRDGSDSEIFLYTRGKGFSRITDNGVDDLYPVISENHIAWIAGGTIHVAEITNLLQVTGLRSQYMLPDGFAARWEPLAGATRYLLDLSTSRDFSSYVPGYHDLEVGGNQPGIDLSGLDTEATYYVRVRAEVNGAITDYSPTATIRLRSAPAGGSLKDRRTPLDSIFMLLL